MAILDSPGRILEVNESLAHWFERPGKELIGQRFWEILGALLPQWQPSLAELGRGSEPFARRELKLSSATDENVSQWFVIESARGRENCFVRLNSVLPPLSELEEGVWDEHLRNDSARREMFTRLLRAEAQLAGLAKRWPCVIFSQRPDFSLQFASPNIEELTGIPTAEWSNQPRRFWELVHESDATELQQQCKRSVQTRAGVTSTYRIRHAQSGQIAYILEHRQPAVSRNGLLLGYEVVWLDVTRQTIAEKRLSTAAWKETLAVLTLGMIHDFRNMMAGIHSLSDSYLQQIDATHPFNEGLGLIRQSSLQANQLVQRVVSLHVGQTGEFAYHNLNEITADLSELVAKILPRRIRIVSEPAEGTLPIYADVVEFRQVVINLLLNAADAMPEGGTLTLRTSRHQALPALENMKGVAPRLPCVCLTIQDTGCGIQERHLASIFDPFFTTKSKGSGLGLYNARLAIEKHQGAISVRSQEGAGTTFQIWLPETDFSETSSLAPQAKPDHTMRRSLLLLGHAGRMLDETAELLRLHNYYVVVATTSNSAREVMASKDYQFAGVLLLAEPNDPSLNAMMDEVRKKDLKVMLKLAGCSQDALERELLSGVDLVLNPDLAQAELLGKLKSVLDKSP